MEATRLEITLKDYLDEKFGEIQHKLNALEMLRQDEHDIIISMARDISFRSEEIGDLKKAQVDCKAECMRRKTDFDKRVVDIVDPRIDNKVKAEASKFWITIISSAILFILGITGYVVDKWVMSPVRTAVERHKK